MWGLISAAISPRSTGSIFPVGRVQTATLGLVCARDEQIESHKKTLYYDVTAVLDVNGVRIDTQYAPGER